MTMSTKIILGIVGEIGCGKDTVADYLRDKHGATMHRFSSVMTDCLDRLGLPKTRENAAAFSEITRHQFGEDLYARVITRDCSADPSPIVIANGVRRPADCVHLRSLPEFKLIYLTVPAETRYQRIRNRGEKAEEHDMSWETFVDNENLPNEKAIRSLGESADFTIENSGTFEDLYRQVEDVLEKCQK
jgi:dephospho-CoA kinase